VFPELCTIKFNTIPSNIATHENTSLRNRNVVQQQQQPQPVRETELNDQHAISRTVMQGKRWLFVLVVFVYLVLSKLIARSSAN
jgi:ubiquitin-conjugating enzyme E2 J2